MDKVIEFKEIITDYIKNDSYMSSVRIIDIQLNKSLLSDNNISEYISLFLYVDNTKFSWEKLPYPDIQNIQFVLDKFNKYILNEYKLFECEVIYKLNYTEIDALWNIKYKYNSSITLDNETDESENNDKDVNDDKDVNNDKDVNDDKDVENYDKDINNAKNSKTSNDDEYINNAKYFKDFNDNKKIEKKHRKKHRKNKLDYEPLYRKNIYSV
ncbi:unknown similar to AMEV224 [Choristoneura rosaceana entomopoxvirus 'L']|uniref:N1R/p28-like protein n=1 Tax=Choristoneura rosaceana entomopoxvirus 'L' TaxID=1293539 RepID=A0ABM9QKS1_9POXV|nr:unknown similar to AMEV224 [Choristoneura rosaceana entomopoxvirus 'L']CCU56128.1 unknown similar to AMEV224 [Choristoneura rosaceana entomopoxvirus 'L']